MPNSILAHSKTYLFIRIQKKNLLRSAVMAFFYFFSLFFVLLDFNINQVMRENNTYKNNVQVLHPMENVCSVQSLCVPAPRNSKVCSLLTTHTHTHTHICRLENNSLSSIHKTKNFSTHITLLHVNKLKENQEPENLLRSGSQDMRSDQTPVLPAIYIDTLRSRWTLAVR